MVPKLVPPRCQPIDLFRQQVMSPFKSLDFFLASLPTHSAPEAQVAKPTRVARCSAGTEAFRATRPARLELPRPRPQQMTCCIFNHIQLIYIGRPRAKGGLAPEKDVPLPSICETFAKVVANHLRVLGTFGAALPLRSAVWKGWLSGLVLVLAQACALANQTELAAPRALARSIR